MNESLVTLVGGPCDGQQVPAFSGRINIPISASGWAHHGEQIDEVAVYELDSTGLRARYVKSDSEGTSA